MLYNLKIKWSLKAIRSSSKKKGKERRRSKPSTYPYMPGGEPPGEDRIFEVGFIHAFDFGIGTGTTQLTVRFWREMAANPKIKEHLAEILLI